MLVKRIFRPEKLGLDRMYRSSISTRLSLKCRGLTKYPIGTPAATNRNKQTRVPLQAWISQSLSGPANALDPRETLQSGICTHDGLYCEVLQPLLPIGLE